MFLFKKNYFTIVLFIINLNIISSQNIESADSLFQEGASLFQNGQYEASINRLQLAENIYREQGDENNYEAYTSLWKGIARYYLLDYEQAQSELKNSLKLSEKYNITDAFLSASLYLANTYFAIDSWDNAYRLYTQTLPVIKKSNSVMYYSSVYEGLGNIDFAWGKYDSAEKYYLMGLEYAERYHMEDNIVNFKIALGRLLFAQNNFEKSIDMYNELLERENIEDSHYYPTILNSLGISYLYIEQDKEALESFLKALKLVRFQNNILEEIRLLIHIGGAYHKLGDYKKALQYYHTALPQALEYERKDDASRALFNIGLTNFYLENFDTSIEFFKKSVDIKEELRLKVDGDSKREYLAEEMRSYQWLAITYLLTNRPDKAVEIMEQGSSKYLRDQLFHDETTLPFPGIKKFQDQLRENQSILKLGNINNLYQPIIYISHNNIRGTYAHNNDILEKISLTFLSDFNDLRESHRGLSSLKSNEDLVLPEKLEPISLVLYFQMLLSIKEDEEEIKRIGRILYNQYLAPIEEDFKDKEHLLIIPDGFMAIIPFEALVMPDGRYLIEKYNITYTQSLAVLDNIRNRIYDENRLDFLGIGNPVYETETKRKMNPLYENILTGNWKNLPGTGIELDKIQEYFDDVLILTGNDASETNIKSLSEQGKLLKYKILHFATHGFVSMEDLNISSLVLSQNETNHNDGYLNISEIKNLRIQADFVNLSACETGLGVIYEGEGVIGLSQAFLVAGAKSLAVSLWQVADESTRDFMTEFYRLIQIEHMSYKDAMAAVKRQFIQSEKYSHPYYWAPFVFYGE